MFYMKFKISLIYFFLFILTYSVGTQANDQNVEFCKQSRADVDLYCSVLKNSCKHLKDCVVRRDTCVVETINSKSTCEDYNSCVQGIKSRFQGQRCEYKWYQSGSRTSCEIESHFLYSEDPCPGNWKIITALAFGSQTFEDNNFQCKTIKDYYKAKKGFCSKQISIFKKYCHSKKDISFISNYKILKCNAYRDYNEKNLRKHAINPTPTKSANNLKRKAGGKKNVSVEDSAKSSKASPK